MATGRALNRANVLCVPFIDYLAICGVAMKRLSVVLFAIMLLAIAAIPNGSVAQGASLKDQLVGTWIYVSSRAKRNDGNNVPSPSLQGAVTYTADGRFRFITTRTDAPKYASGDLARPSPDEAMAIASDRSPTRAHIRWTKAQKRFT